MIQRVFLKSNSIYYTLIDFDSSHTYREYVMNCTEYISLNTSLYTNHSTNVGIHLMAHLFHHTFLDVVK